MAPPDGQLDGLICPRTGKPCQARSYADCREFWECVRKVLAQAEPAPAPPAPRGGREGEQVRARDAHCR